MTPLEVAPAASHGSTGQASASLSSCLEDLPQTVLMGLCRAGAAHRMPLTVALVSERARQQAAALDSLAWRDLIAGTWTLCGHLDIPVCTAGVFLLLFENLRDPEAGLLCFHAPLFMETQLACILSKQPTRCLALKLCPANSYHVSFSTARTQWPCSGNSKSPTAQPPSCKTQIQAFQYLRQHEQTPALQPMADPQNHVHPHTVILLGTDVVEVTATAQAAPAAHLHLVAPWLQVLLWLDDARWRKLGAAAPVDQVQQLLDCLQGHVALLWTAFPSTPTSHDSSEPVIHDV